MAEEAYFRVVADDDVRATTGDSTGIKLTELADLTCWETGGFGVCVESWNNDRLKLGIYVGGVRVATATLTANDPCFKIREGNDILKVRADVCADFARRHVTAKGKVCSFGLCIEFSQIIFQW